MLDARERKQHLQAAAPYRQCSVSVLDTNDDPDMRFDSEGRSQYYHLYAEAEREHVLHGEKGRIALEKLADEIRRSGSGERYDCIVGVSGGVDSTYVAYLANQLGLRPLAVHFDNGWNSEIAVRNVENIVNKFGWDLHTLVIDWAEFRDLQRAYIFASVVDIEVATDHAIAATLFGLARKFGVRYLLSGSNVVTEAILPPHWIFNKLDHVNLIDIHRKYGILPLRTYPVFGTISKKVSALKRIRWVSPLNMIDYDYERAKETIAKEVGWIDYGGKHFESVFTRFYQCEILPKKFGIDKRKAHLSNLIFSGQLTKSEANDILSKPACDPDKLQSDRAFVLKKLGFTENEFEELMRVPPRPHSDFATERPLADRYPSLRAVRPALTALKHALRLMGRG